MPLRERSSCGHWNKIFAIIHLTGLHLPRCRPQKNHFADRVARLACQLPSQPFSKLARDRRAAPVGVRSEFHACPRGCNPYCYPYICVNQPQYGLCPGVLRSNACHDHQNRGCDAGRDNILGPVNQNQNHSTNPNQSRHAHGMEGENQEIYQTKREA
jgi:hypothetical protein